MFDVKFVFMVLMVLKVRIFVTEIFVEDCYRHDPCSSDKTSEYTLPSGLSLIFDTDHYILSSSTTNTTSIEFYDGISGDFEISALFNTGNRNQGLSLYKDASLCNIYGVSSGTGLAYVVNGTFGTNRTGSTLNNNTWYKYTLKQTGSKIVGIIETLGGTKFGQWEFSMTGTTSAGIVSAWNVTSQIKNIKVKAL